MQDIGGAPAPANPAAVYSELGGVAGPADVLPNVSGTIAVDDNDDVSYVLSLCLHVSFYYRTKINRKHQIVKFS